MKTMWENRIAFDDFMNYVSEQNKVEWVSKTTFSVTPTEEDASTAFYERGDDAEGWYVSQVGYPTKMRTIAQWEELYPYTFRGW